MTARRAGVLAVTALLLVSAGACTEVDQATTPPTTPTTGTPTTSLPAPGPSTTATTIEPGAPPTTTARPTGPTPARAPVDRLEVAAPDPTVPTYERDRFGDGWDYDPTSGCNTRERVLIAEAIVAPTVDGRCRSTDGRWRSAYDGVETSDPADLEVDHLVPLADAWRSGAHAWTDDRREAFANHLADPEELIAVTSSTNRSKGDSAPDAWLPPDRDAWCAYAEAWVEVKLRWQLTVTPAEKAALVQVLAGC